MENPLTFLSGAVRQEILGMRPDLGLILTPMMGNAPDLTQVQWAADTGCYSQPEKYNDQRYLDFLDKRPRETCLFATAPDVVPDAEATWAKSRPMLWQIRELGFPAALVAQNGIEHMNVQWNSFDALFIGGTTEWKLGPVAFDIGIEARRRGKHLHWGRVNSLKRLWKARKAHANSADGTYIAFAPDILLPRVCRWLNMVNSQLILF